MENQLLQKDRNNQILILISVIGIMISFGGSYISGGEPSMIIWRTLDWTQSLAISLLVNKVCILLVKETKDERLLLLPYLLLISPLLYSFDFVFRRSYDISEYIYLLFGIISTIISFLVAFKIINIINKKNTVLLEKEETFEAPQDDEIRNKQPKKITILDKVILSTIQRANASNKAIFVNLLIMVIIVIIGGSASFGTVALNEASKIRELETERLKMIEIVNKIQAYDSTTVKEIKEIISSKYGVETSYKSIMENVEKQSYVSWPDIAMRATIAALTLFLVQIFFHIYKYNQQQAALLFSKAEILQLYNEPDANQNELRSGLLSKIDSNPSFDKTPSTPTDQIVNIIKDSK